MKGPEGKAVFVTGANQFFGKSANKTISTVEVDITKSEASDAAASTVSVAGKSGAIRSIVEC